MVCAGIGSRKISKSFVNDVLDIYPVKGYSLLQLSILRLRPWTFMLDDEAKIVTPRLGEDRLRVAGTAESQRL